MEDSSSQRPTSEQESGMPEGRKSSKAMEDAEEVKEILTVVSEKVPALIKGLISSVFSPEAASGMGKAAATYYKELKEGGMPDDVALAMTKDYVSTFSKVSDFLRTASGGGATHVTSDISREIELQIKKKLKDKYPEDEKD